MTKPEPVWMPNPANQGIQGGNHGTMSMIVAGNGRMPPRERQTFWFCLACGWGLGFATAEVFLRLITYCF